MPLFFEKAVSRKNKVKFHKKTKKQNKTETLRQQLEKCFSSVHDILSTRPHIHRSS